MAAEIAALEGGWTTLVTYGEIPTMVDGRFNTPFQYTICGNSNLEDGVLCL